MKKGIVLLGLVVFLSVSLATSLMLNPGVLNAQVQQKVLQQRKTLMVLKPSVTSANPQKAVLTRGGDPVVVEANGANLGLINSAQVLRAGATVAEIEATLDKSQLPTTLKVSLKASSTAPIASDYQLAVFDAGNQKLLDVPIAVLAVEVVAPGTKTFAMITTRKPPQQVTLPKDRIAAARTNVASISPQKAILFLGGEAVVVEAKGDNLTAVGSVQVTRGGVEAPGIEETLDKSQLPTTLKVSLNASTKATVANDYHLSVFDAGNNKLLDVPNTVLAIEVQAPSLRAQRTTATPRAVATTTREFPKLQLPSDLIVQDIRIDPPNPTNGGEGFDVYATIKNKGEGGAFLPRGWNLAASAFSGEQPVRFWGRDAYMNVDNVALPAGASLEVLVHKYRGQSSSPAGTWTVTVRADPENQVAELHEGNNEKSVELTIADLNPPPEPSRGDLIITEVWLDPAEATIAGNFKVVVIIKNQAGGAVLLPEFLRVLQGSNIEDYQFEFGMEAITLQPGEIREFRCTPSRLQRGTFQMWLVVDPDNRVPELDENNNRKLFEATIK